jgi:hypothetical protein
VALTVADVVNRALSYVGSRLFITDINEDSEQAIVAKVHYSACVAMVLGERWWNFAEASALLNRLSITAPSGWSFAYQLPADLLPGKQRFIYPGARPGLTRGSKDEVPFSLRWISGSGQTLLTDHESPELLYTRLVTELVYWPEKAADALAWCLAPRLALGLNVDLRKGVAFEQQYQSMLEQAMADDMNSVRRGPELSSSYQAGRG